MLWLILRYLIRRFQYRAAIIGAISRMVDTLSPYFEDDIDWIESAGNYVNLHAGARVFPLRETMANISGRLATQGFQRVHRSAIVNLERIAEIVPFDTGDGEALLTSDTWAPISRRYRKKLRERLS